MKGFCYIARFLTVFALGMITLGLSAVDITIGNYENRSQFIVKTEMATWYYDREGGGFSRLIDKENRDWVAFSRKPLKKFPESAAAGFRGIPNLLYGSTNPDAGAGHPGFDKCESILVNERTIQTRTLSGNWEWGWEFSETSATFTMTKASPDHSWWFLYEGPIAGSYDPDDKFWGTDRRLLNFSKPHIRKQLFLDCQWAYFGDRNINQVFFIAQHKKDSLTDTLWYLGSSDRGKLESEDGMLVFGLGRGPKTKPLFTGLGEKITVGFLEVATLGAAPEEDLINSVNKDVRQQMDSLIPKREE